MDRKTLISELAKKYTFENFDFKNNSIEELLNSYDKNYSKLSEIVEKEENEIINSSRNTTFAGYPEYF